ncbi:MAG: ABC transporter permease [Erysipelotrichales bacterium]|nr:ABC transporter permease [Erysipelotrichales bacterium]
MKSINRIFSLTIRNLKEILRDPLSLIFLFLLPLVMLVLFYFLFGNLTIQFEIKYFAPGIAAFGGAFISLFMGILIANDRSSAFLTRLYTTPTKSYEFILGYAFAMFPIGLLQTILFFLVSALLDSTILSWNILLVIVVNLLVTMLFIGFGVFFGSLCNEKSIGGFCSILIMGQSVLSGMWFPIEGLSKGFITFMEVLPFRNSVLLLQNIMLGNGEYFKPLLIIIAYTISIFAISIFTYAKKMKQK